jgi:hypothetical protein
VKLSIIVHIQRSWLLHWALFVYFKPDDPKYREKLNDEVLSLARSLSRALSLSSLSRFSLSSLSRAVYGRKGLQAL